MIKRDADRGFAVGWSKSAAYEFNEASENLALAWNTNDANELTKALKRYEVRQREKNLREMQSCARAGGGEAVVRSDDHASTQHALISAVSTEPPVV